MKELLIIIDIEILQNRSKQLVSDGLEGGKRMVLLFLARHGRLVVAEETVEQRICSPYHWAG
jgi:hypothetical protein